MAINLREPGLIARAYEALPHKNYRARTNAVRNRPGVYLVSCPSSYHADEHPSCHLDTQRNWWRCWTHPGGWKKGGIIEMLIEAGVLQNIDGRNDAHRAFLWLEENLDIARDLRDQNQPRARDAGEKLRDERYIELYPYPDDDGSLSFQLLRYEGYNSEGIWDKKLKFRRPAGVKRWIYHREAFCADNPRCPCQDLQTPKRFQTAARILPYRLPQLIAAAKAHATIVFCEGEKDANAIARLGIAATTVPFGAGAPIERHWLPYFAGAGRIIIIPDCDATGREAAITRAAVLSEVAPTAIVDLDPTIESPDYDVSAFLKQFPTPRERKSQLVAIVRSRLQVAA